MLRFEVKHGQIIGRLGIAGLVLQGVAKGLGRFGVTGFSLGGLAGAAAFLVAGVAEVVGSVVVSGVDAQRTFELHFGIAKLFAAGRAVQGLAPFEEKIAEIVVRPVVQRIELKSATVMGDGQVAMSFNFRGGAAGVPEVFAPLVAGQRVGFVRAVDFRADGDGGAPVHDGVLQQARFLHVVAVEFHGQRAGESALGAGFQLEVRGVERALEEADGFVVLLGGPVKIEQQGEIVFDRGILRLEVESDPVEFAGFQKIVVALQVDP